MMGDLSRWDIARENLPTDVLDWICISSGTNTKGEWAMWAAYPPNYAIIERLDKAFGPSGWNFTVVDNTETAVGDKCVVTVHGRLEIDGAIREQFGADTVGKKSSDTDFYKSAASRALVKCAQFFGIGDECRDIPFEYTNGDRAKYNPPTFKPGQKGGGDQGQSKSRSGQSNNSSPANSSATKGGGSDKPASEKQNNAIKAMQQKLREMLGEKDADDMLKAWAKEYGADLRKLTSDQASKIIKAQNNILKAGE